MGSISGFMSGAVQVFSQGSTSLQQQQRQQQQQQAIRHLIVLKSTMSPKTQHPHSIRHCHCSCFSCFSCFPSPSLLLLLLLSLTRQRHQYVLSRGSVGQCIQMAWMPLLLLLLLLLPSAWPKPWPRQAGSQAAAVGSLSPPHCVGCDVKLCTLTICYIPGNGYTRLGCGQQHIDAAS